MESTHSEEWKDWVKDEEEKAKEEKTKEVEKRKREDTQPKIAAVMNNLTKVNPLGAKQKAYDKCLVEFLACKFIPLQVVESVEVKNLINLLDKTINTKDRETYSRQVETFAEEVLAEVKELMVKNCDVSAAITTDLWTSRARDSYISITLHFIDKDFRLHRW